VIARRAAQVDRLLTWLENFVAAVALAVAVTLSVVGVLLRYLFDYVIFWSEEASLYLVVLSTFFGASIALRHKDHVGVDILAQVARGRPKQVVNVVGVLVVVVYAGLFSVLGWMMVTSPIAGSFQTPALSLPLWVPQLAVPLGLTLILIRSAQILYRTIRGRDPYPDARDVTLADEEPAA
jgi:C4-dicarboxylate transporter DctQ subunit